MPQPSRIEQRIRWTRFRRQTDKDVLLALARWFCWRADGTHVQPSSTDALAARSGVPKRSVERALARLIDGGYLRVTATRNRGPTTYQIVLDRLATEDPDQMTIAVDNTRAFDRQSGGREDDVGASAARVADETNFDRQSGGRTKSGGRENGRDFEKVADPYGSEEEVEEEICTPTAASDRVRQSGGRTETIAVFCEWWTMTYPTYNTGRQNPIDVAHDGDVIRDLLETYTVEDVQQMSILAWRTVADKNPHSNPSYIAGGDRGIRVIRRKAEFLYRSLTVPEQLTFGPMEAVTLSAKELQEAKRLLSFAYGGYCPHDPACEDWKACVREIALARHIS